MALLLVILTLILVTAVGLYLHKRSQQMREARIGENEYSAATSIWNFGRILKAQMDETLRQGTGVMDFSRIVIPHSTGYRFSLELAGYIFRVYAVPAHHNKTSRLSFFIDNTLTVRAADHNGEPASEMDPEYEGNALA